LIKLSFFDDLFLILNFNMFEQFFYFNNTSNVFFEVKNIMS